MSQHLHQVLPRGPAAARSRRKLSDGGPGSSSKIKNITESNKISTLGKKLLKHVSDLEKQIDAAQSKESASAPWLAPIVGKCKPRAGGYPFFL